MLTRLQRTYSLYGSRLPPRVCTECSELVSNGMFAYVHCVSLMDRRGNAKGCMYVCMYVCTYVCLRVCVCAKVLVIKARGNVAVNLKLMMCSSGYCVWLEAIDTHTHVHACAYTYKHGWYLSLTIVYVAPKQRRHANI